ncbi:hypothetical protein [Burkholderia savannae]|nr:hypothetical protein [Burkholderia savannae]
MSCFVGAASCVVIGATTARRASAHAPNSLARRTALRLSARPLAFVD